MSKATKVFYNKTPRRMMEKTNKFFYNCGGYALETFDWFRPYDDTFGPVRKFKTDPDGVREYAQYIVDKVPGVRIIPDEKCLTSEEYLVAFRTCKNDFHFCKRDNSGHWWHKMGGASWISRIKKSEVFSPYWISRYNSPIVLLAVEK